ncbi:nuclear transport factor 2 family protein [Streptomyces sp. NPDC006422]|uniref:nuclear transport factor 2 family protein n=1 Tax=unclassified Streptomyces TaxID=2593676 RepID=UPI0033B3189F
MTSQTDHFDISMLVSRFFRALDAREFKDGWAWDFFTDDVRTVTPLGTTEGSAVVAETEVSVERYARTQHISSDVLVDTAGDSAGDLARASWNALMTHVHHDTTLERLGEGVPPLFTVGGRYDAELRRTPEGWRIAHMTVHAIWTSGHPPVLP